MMASNPSGSFTLPYLQGLANATETRSATGVGNETGVRTSPLRTFPSSTAWTVSVPAHAANVSASRRTRQMFHTKHTIRQKGASRGDSLQEYAKSPYGAGITPVSGISITPHVFVFGFIGLRRVNSSFSRKSAIPKQLQALQVPERVAGCKDLIARQQWGAADCIQSKEGVTV